MITGKPGAGKTLLVSNVLKTLTEKQYRFLDGVEGLEASEDSKARGFKITVLQYNAMAFSLCFPLLLEIISNMYQNAGLEFDRSLYGNGTYLLEMFKLNIEKILAKHIFIILIDELDTLSNHDKKNFELINDMLNIADKRFVKIGISNTLDLFATYKNTKRYVECKQMAFKPYGEEDLYGILRERFQTAGQGSQNLLTVIDDGTILRVCKKLAKYALGDTRVILSMVKDILERKLTTIRKDLKKVEPGEDRLTPAQYRVSLIEAMVVIDEKYGDMQKAIINTLSLPVQSVLLALYFAIEGNALVVPYVDSY